MKPVAFDVPVEVAFDYLVDPRNRPEWQSSLRRVEVLDDVVAPGQRWVDVTTPGLRPRMRTTDLRRPHSWTEVGTWRGVEAWLTLTFAARGAGCSVLARARVRGRGPWRPLGPLATMAATLAVPGDLRRASGILSERNAGH